MTIFIEGQHDAFVLSDLLTAQHGGGTVTPVLDKDGITVRGHDMPTDLARDADGAIQGYADAVTARFVKVRAGLKAQVDDRAEALRLRLVTPGAGQAMEYQEALAEASEVASVLRANANAILDPAAYPMLSASIGTALDPATAKPTADIAGEARAVLAAADAGRKVLAAIRDARLKGKLAIDATLDAAAAQAAFLAIAWPTPD